MVQFLMRQVNLRLMNDLWFQFGIHFTMETLPNNRFVDPEAGQGSATTIVIAVASCG